MKKIFLATLVVAAMTANANTYPDLPKGLKDGGGALIGDVAYVGLGSLGEDFYALNLAKDKADWEKLPSFPGGERSQPVVAADNRQLYVFGGLQKNEKGELQLVNDAYVYQPAEKAWKKLPTRSPLGLVGTVAATKGDKIYFVGGSNLSIFNGYFQDYTAAGKDEAKQKSVMTAYFNQRPQDYFFNTQLFSYEPSQNRWYNEGALPFSGRAGAAVAAEGDILIVANGEVKPGLRTAEAARATFTDKGISWQALPNLPDSAENVPQEGLAGAYSGFSNDYYLIAGGANFPGARQQFESGQLYAHEGLKKTYQSAVYALSLKDNQWKKVGELAQGAGYGVSLSYQGKVVLIGGATADEPLKSVQTMSYDGKDFTLDK